jgi:Tellurite resistance protein TerB.
MFYQLLFELSMADGHLDPAEEEILSQAIPIFGLDPDLFNLNKRKFGADISDAYAVLGVTKDMSYKEIKTALSKKKKKISS